MSASLHSQIFVLNFNKSVHDERNLYSKTDLWLHLITHAYNGPMQTLHQEVKVAKIVQ